MNSKAIFCIVLILCLLSVAACKKDSAGTHTADDILEITDRRVSDDNFSIPADGASQYIEIRTNIADWVADVNGTEWLSATPVREPEIPATGVGVVQKLKITAAENPNKHPRNAAIRINGRGITLTLNVVQAAAGDVLTFNTPVYAAAAGEILEIPVTANVGYMVSIPESCGWIEDISAQAGGAIRLKISKNDGAKSRSADLDVAAAEEGLSKTLTVEQHGSEAAIDVDGPEIVNVAWDEPHLTLNVTANVAYSVEFSPAVSWISHAAGTRAVAKEEKFLLTANEETEPRTVRICFLSDDEAVSPALRREITVIQGVFTMPSEEVFELTDIGSQNITSEFQSFTIEIRTGKDAGAITVGGADDWITQIGQPQRIKDVLAYTFDIAENNWPLKRHKTLSFISAGGTVEVTVYQDTGATGKYVEYNSVSGEVMGGSADLLYDCNLGTSLMSGSYGWPKEWTLGLKNQTDNEFNRLTYYPITGFAASGIGGYELLAFSATNGTWYSVVSGTIPTSFYDDEAAMRKGFNIDFPNVKNAKSLILRVKGVRGGGSIFGASEIHLTCDHSLNIPYTQSLNIQTTPSTLGYGASSFTVGVDAAVPFKVTVDADWITCQPSSQPGIMAFSVSANSGARRSATVTLNATASGVSLSRSFTVVQDENPATLEFSSPPSGGLNLSYSTQNFTSDLATDIPMDEIVCGTLPEWLTLVEKSEPVSGTVRFGFSALANGGGTRNHTITFSGRGRILGLMVTQDSNPGVTPYISVLSPDPTEVLLGADPDPAKLEIVLATNMGSADITVGSLPDWLTAGTPIDGTGRVTYTFTAAPNSGDLRSVELTFTVAGAPTVSVIVCQAASGFTGVRVQPTEAVWYDLSLNVFDASETIDGNKNTHHTVTTGNIWAYEFRFANSPELAGLIYYPRDSATDHGAFKTIKIQVVVREGGVAVEPYTVEIPQSVFATSESRRAGWPVKLPVKARLVSHLRIIPEEGWQSHYSVGEVEFFSSGE